MLCVCSSAVKATLYLLRISSVLTPFRMFALSCSSEDKGVRALLAGRTLSHLRSSAVRCVPFSYETLETQFLGIQQLKSKTVIVNNYSEGTGSLEKGNNILKRRI